MSSPRELLALRKEVLVARASLQRLKAVHEVDALRASLRWPRAAASIAASAPGRSMIFGLLLLVARRGSAARFVRLAGGAILAARLAVTLRDALRLSAAGSPAAATRRNSAPDPAAGE